MGYKYLPDSIEPEADRAIVFVDRWRSKYPGLPARVMQLKYLRMRNGFTLGDMAQMIGMSAAWWSKLERGAVYDEAVVKKALDRMLQIDSDYRDLQRRRIMALNGVHLPMTEV